MKLILLIFLPIFLFATTQKISVGFAWKHQFQYAGFYTALENGYYKNIGLDVELKSCVKGCDITTNVIKKKITFGVSSSALLLQKLQNKPVVLAASYFKQNALVLISSKDIKTIQDLKNKKIMLMDDSIKYTSIGAMLKDNHIYEDNLTLIKQDYTIDKFVSAEVDAFSAYLTSQTFMLDKLGIEYNILNPADYGIYSYDLELFTSKDTAQKHSIMVQNFIDATNKGWEYAFKHKRKTVDLIHKKYNSNISKEALLYEAIQTEKLFKTDIFKIGAISPELTELNAQIYKKLGLVAADIPLKELLSGYIFKKHYASSKVTPQNTKLSLKEQKYLKDKKKITMCIDPDWMPFESFKDDVHIGLSADYFKIFEQSIGIPIEVQTVHTWSESLSMAQKRECDIISLIMRTPSREKYLNFTQPYLRVPLVLATKPEVAFISDIGSLTKKKIGIPKGYAFGEILQNRFPNLKIVYVKNTKDGLQKVSDGKLFGYIGTLASVGYLFQREFVGELKIAGKFDEDWELGIGVRNDDPILLNIFDKVVQSLDNDTHRDILNRWIAIKYEESIDYTLLWEIIAISMIILLISLYWGTKLSILNKELTIAKEKADEATKEKSNFLANISHEIRTPMNAIHGMTYLLKATKLNDTQEDYIHKIENASDNLLLLIGDILDFSKLEARKLHIEYHDFNLLELINNVQNIVMIKSFDKGLELKTTYDKTELNTMHGDSLRISQVLINLLSNAIKFTEKGTVELIIKKTDNNRFRFEVVDTGIGLTEEVLQDIFSSFTQADSSITRKYGGTGLGLAISKELVKLMNGEIWVESIYGVGSSFIFEIELKASKVEIPYKPTAIKIEKNFKDIHSKTVVNQQHIKELFSKLKLACKKRRPKLSQPILQEIKQYNLNKKDAELFRQVENLIKKYKFNDVVELL